MDLLSRLNARMETKLSKYINGRKTLILQIFHLNQKVHCLLSLMGMEGMKHLYIVSDIYKGFSNNFLSTKCRTMKMLLLNALLKWTDYSEVQMAKRK